MSTTVNSCKRVAPARLQTRKKSSTAAPEATTATAILPKRILTPFLRLPPVSDGDVSISAVQAESSGFLR